MDCRERWSLRFFFRKRGGELGPSNALIDDWVGIRCDVLGMLRNIEHNARPRSAGPSWSEFTADCPQFPLRLRPAFDIRALKERGR